MGFPLCYDDLFFPSLVFNIITFFALIRKFIFPLLSFLGLAGILESEPPFPSRTEHSSTWAALIRELLPVVKFKELVEPPESCAVCLCDFEEEDEIRQLTNCRHVFHRSCVDRWMDHDHKTCPLCRTAFCPADMQEALNESLWSATRISDLYADFPPTTSDL